MKFLVQKQFGKLVPCYNSDAESLADCRLKEGVQYEVEIKLKRNAKHHAKYFALLNLCYENAEGFDSISDLRYYLTCKAGYYHRVVTNSGEMIIADSISFASMDQTVFNVFYKKSLDAVCNLLGCIEDDLIQELSEFI